MRITPLMLVGGAAALYLLSKSKTKRYLTGLRVQLKSVAPVGLTELQLSFNIDNPNVKDSTVKSLVGDVTVNGTKVARVQTFNQVIIRGNSQSLYPVTVKLLPVRAIATLVDLVKGGVANSQVVFKGTINYDDVAQPLDIKYTT